MRGYWLAPSSITAKMNKSYKGVKSSKIDTFKSYFTEYYWYCVPNLGELEYPPYIVHKNEVIHNIDCEIMYSEKQLKFYQDLAYPCEDCTTRRVKASTGTTPDNKCDWYYYKRDIPYSDIRGGMNLQFYSLKMRWYYQYADRETAQKVIDEQKIIGANILFNGEIPPNPPTPPQPTHAPEFIDFSECLNFFISRDRRDPSSYHDKIFYTNNGWRITAQLPGWYPLYVYCRGPFGSYGYPPGSETYEHDIKATIKEYTFIDQAINDNIQPTYTGSLTMVKVKPFLY